MGLLLGQLADSWDQLAMMQNFFLTPLSFLGGIFYSIKMLPDWAQQLSLVNLMCGRLCLVSNRYFPSPKARQKPMTRK